MPTQISANTENTVCINCTGDTQVVIPPHPIYINSNGDEVVQMNAITLGGVNGLNN